MDSASLLEALQQILQEKPVTFTFPHQLLWKMQIQMIQMSKPEVIK